MKIARLRYIPNVLTLMREHRWFFLGSTFAALALRLFFFFHFPAITDDSHVYANLATNGLQRGVYGQAPGGQPDKPIVPTDTRLPGYPAFLAGIFWLFGAGNFKAVMLTQILADLGTCLIVADLARRTVSERAARSAFVLAALCPFLANYAAAVLTETLEIFFTALALDCAAAALNRVDEGRAEPKLWAATGAAIAGCILLPPDGGILLVAVVLYLRVAAHKGVQGFEARDASLKRSPDTKPQFFRSAVTAGIIVAFFALAPLRTWTIRNFRTLHQFQPLAPRYANETDELVPEVSTAGAKPGMATHPWWKKFPWKF